MNMIERGYIYIHVYMCIYYIDIITGREVTKSETFLCKRKSKNVDPNPVIDSPEGGMVV